MKDEVSMDFTIQYDKSEWKNVLEINPDFFYLRDDKQIFFGSKDYKQVKRFKIAIESLFSPVLVTNEDY